MLDSEKKPTDGTRAGNRRAVFSTGEKLKGEPKPMDAPSQNMNALSVQSLFFVNDEAMHEIDLKVLAKLPETLRLLQEQVQSLTSSSAVASPKHHQAQEVESARTAEVTTDDAPSFSRRARQQQPAVVA